MDGPEMIVFIVAIACTTGLIKTWINNRYKEVADQESFDRLARAFMQHKKEMQERIQNLEEIVADDEETDFGHIEAPTNEGNLNNDLQQKDKVR